MGGSSKGVEATGRKYNLSLTGLSYSIFGPHALNRLRFRKQRIAIRLPRNDAEAGFPK